MRVPTTGMFIEKCVRINGGPIHVMKGDQFRLSWNKIDGTSELVMVREFDGHDSFSHAACVHIDGSIGYLIGKENLFDSLVARGFTPLEGCCGPTT